MSQQQTRMQEELLTLDMSVFDVKRKEIMLLQKEAQDKSDQYRRILKELDWKTCLAHIAQREAYEKQIQELQKEIQ